MTERNNELAPVVVDERGVLEKIDNDSGQIVERVHVHNGTIILHEFLEDGVVVESHTYHTYGGDE